MTIQPSAVLNTAGFGNRGENVEIPYVSNPSRAPTSSDTSFPIGKRWIDTSVAKSYELNALNTIGGVLTASWAETSVSSGGIDTINNVAPSMGNFTVLGTTNQVAITNGVAEITLSIPNTFVAPGSIEATTSIKADNGFTALGIVNINATGSGSTTTIGNITDGNVIIVAPTVNINDNATTIVETVNILSGSATGSGTQVFNLLGAGSATNGGLINIGTGAAPHAVVLGNIAGNVTSNAPVGITLASGASDGLTIDTSLGTGEGITITTSAATVSAMDIVTGGIKVPVTSGGTGASPITVNARFGTATFTGVTITNGTPQNFVINNSLITSATQAISINMYGATAGTSPVIRNVVLDPSGFVTITVTNSAAVDSFNKTFVFWLMD